MNVVAAGKYLINLLIRLEIGVNRALGREFIKKNSTLFHIETSSACNLKCRFCAYTKKSTPTVSMSDEVFASTVQQALDLGYRDFELTPCTGDVFMDRKFFDKLDRLERDHKVGSYSFFTNLTIPKPATVARLATLTKLGHMTVSVYGHDAESFVAIAQGTPKLYARLLANLETLLAMGEQRPFGLAIALKLSRKPPRQPSDLMRLIGRCRAAGIEIWRSPGEYNNWGGYISQADVEGLDMQIGSTESTYKYGACEKLFDSVQVTATGVVNACACRDVDATLRIGDIRTTPLADIVSLENPRYMAIIEQQQRGEFAAVCRNCDFYKSIYHYRSGWRHGGIQTISLDEFRQQLADRRAAASATTNCS